MRRPYFLTIIIFFVSVNLSACSCSFASKSFKDNLNFPYILEVEVLEHFDYKKEPNDHFVLIEGYTKLLVHRSLKSESLYDTLLFQNGQGSMCEINLGYYDVGERFLLKGWEVEFISFTDFSRDPIEAPSKQDTFFVDLAKKYKTIKSTICEHTILRIDGQFVEGHLTRNKLREKYKIHRLLNKVNYDMAEYYRISSMNYDNTIQKMKLEKYWRILRRNVS